MTGDQQDIVARLQRWLPQGWFPNDAGTRIYAILSGFASVFATIYAGIAYALLQTRIATATDGFLDLASSDFFGTNLPRLTAEGDPSFSLRIRNEVLRPRLTRAAIDKLLFDLTGQHPTITELANGNDCLSLRGPYGLRVGSMGSRSWPFTVFIKTTHAGVFGINTGGLRNPNAALRVPTFVYTDPSMTTGTGLTDTQLLDALDRIRAAGVTFWVWIQ